MKRLRRIRAFARDFEKKKKESKRITEAMLKGAKGTQSFNIFDTIPQKESKTLCS
jgi:hypothetical protein